jgi:hypothetical protein
MVIKSSWVTILKNPKVHLRIDATYFKQFCLLYYQDHHLNYTQLLRFSNGEHYQKIKEDLDINNLFNSTNYFSYNTISKQFSFYVLFMLSLMDLVNLKKIKIQLIKNLIRIESS